MKRSRAKLAKPPHAEGVRVAIYTRQSVEDAKNPFNSIAAQREAVASYVASQAERGWRALDTRYDDPGFSGSTLKRPAMTQLLADIDAGLIDVVAVYKFDRLSRVQMDFLRTVEDWRERGVAFVSITQAFDTETITGRAMLGMLGIFAQMERETISERTRDKIHATRRKGMWTGGPVPLGYDLRNKSLEVNEDEAVRVRAMFSLFLDTGSIMATVTALRDRAWLTKSRTTSEGKSIEARPFTKSLLYGLLTNPIYVGRVRLGDETHTGVHPAIVAQDVFDAVQAALTGDARPTVPEAQNTHGVLLRGLLVCAACGSRMTHSFTSKGSKAWGSYVCSTAQKSGARACPGSRIAVGKIEAVVVERIRAVARDPQVVEATIAEACRELEARRPELAAEIDRHEGERRRIERERDNLIDGIAKGGGDALTPRLAAIEREHAAVVERIRIRKVEVEQLATRVVDADVVRRALAEFNDVWAELAPRERTRVLSLLIERVAFDGRIGQVEITFRPSAPKSLEDVA